MRTGFVMTVVVALMTGAIVSYSAFADTTPTAKKVESLKQEIEAADKELKTITDSKASEQKGIELKQKNLELSKLEKELNPNPEKELDDLILGMETALEIRVKGYEAQPVNHHAIAIVKEKQKMLAELKKNQAAKTKSTEQLLNDLMKIRDIQEDVPTNIVAP